MKILVNQSSHHRSVRSTKTTQPNPRQFESIRFEMADEKEEQNWAEYRRNIGTARAGVAMPCIVMFWRVKKRVDKLFRGERGVVRVFVRCDSVDKTRREPVCGSVCAPLRNCQTANFFFSFSCFVGGALCGLRCPLCIYVPCR